MHCLSLLNNAITIVINNIWFAFSILLLRLSLLSSMSWCIYRGQGCRSKDALISPQLHYLICSRNFQSGKKYFFLSIWYIVSQTTGNSFATTEQYFVLSHVIELLCCCCSQTAAKMPRSLLHYCDNTLRHYLIFYY